MIDMIGDNFKDATFPEINRQFFSSADVRSTLP